MIFVVEEDPEEPLLVLELEHALKNRHDTAS
jgi:hypothetical protein